MRTRPFGPAKTPVSILGQGTWRLRNPTSAEEALRVGLDLGLTHVDTAELYQNQSQSEDIVGRAIHGRRNDVYLASKVLPHNASYKGTKAALEATLKRLGTDAVDLYYLHWVGDLPIAETMRAMVELVDAGKVRHVGVSNFDVAELEEAKSALGPKRLAANQVLYHLGARGIESEILPWCKRNGVALVAYSPFGSGKFPSSRTKGGKVLEGVAGKLGKTPHQVALAFLARDPSVFPIPKAEQAAHVRENAGGDFDLAPEDIEALDAAFPVVPGLSFL